MEKQEARRIVRDAVRALSPSARAEKSAEVTRRVLALPELKASRTVMAFLPLPDELDTIPLLADLLIDRKNVYVPRTLVKEHRMFPVRLTSLIDVRQGDYEILEPTGDETCAVSDIDFLIVPGRAFDPDGNRLGRGAGYYDAFMSQPGFRARKCAVAFACQMLPDVPHDETDVPVDVVVTEEDTLRVRRMA